MNGVHAIQLEMGQAAYMEEDAPYRFLPERADKVIPVLRDLLTTGLSWVEANGRAG